MGQSSSDQTLSDIVVLPIRPRSIADEATQGYLMRVAQVNGYASLAQLLAIFRTLGEFRAAMLLTDVELSDLLGPYPAVWRQKSIGSGLEVSDFNYSLMRWCPLCLSESPYLRGMWLLKLGCVCTRHAIKLCDRCHQCGRQQRMQRSDFEHCDCGASLSTSVVTEAGPALVRLMASLEAVIVEQTIELKLPVLPTSAWLRLVRYLGQFSTNGLPAKPGKVVNLNQLEVAMGLMLNTANLLDDWPTNFHALLDVLYQREKQATSILQAFGSLFRVLYVQMKEPHFQFLRDAFEQFVQQYWEGVIGKRNQLFTARTIQSHPRLTLKQAAKQAGTGLATVRHLLQADLITAHKANLPSGRSATSIHRALVDEIARLANSTLSFEEAAKLLALPKCRVRLLIDAGLITPLISPQATGAASWQISINELNWFKLKPQLVTNSTVDVSITKILQHWRLHDEEFVALVRALITLELLPIATHTEPTVIGKVQLDRAKFQVWLDRRRFDALQTMSIDSAAKLLGLKQQVVYELIRKGLIESTHEQTKGYRISANQINQFRGAFISLAELARLHHTSSKKLLLELDVTPVSGPVIDGARQYFFRRSEVNLGSCDLGDLNSSGQSGNT